MTLKPSDAQLELLRKKREALEAQLREGLPHLYGHKWYAWQRAFFQARQRIGLLTAANQIGKSTVQMWKCIHWATAINLWSELWREAPKLFWYLYPDKATAAREFKLKWERDWLPKGKFKDDPQYGWKANTKRTRGQDEIISVEFNSGVLLEFKTYSQDVHNLQGGTVAAIFCDEELPEFLWDELKQRLADTKGYFHSVFTATRNQQMWRRAMECKGDLEMFPDAFKRQVSKYDCLVFDDGSPGRYTEDEIATEIAECSSKTEVDRRIFGKFVTEEGRKYPAFDPAKHYTKPVHVPENWKVYSGVDVGSGGDRGHPAAMTFIAVRPDYRLGYVFKGQRLDNVQTTAGDVLKHYIELRGADKHRMVEERYDYHSKDFGIIAERSGEPFTMADKNHERGEQVINTLFEHGMLYIFDTPELTKLGGELLTLMRDTDKRAAVDDFCFAGETLVYTNRGNLPISTVVPGDEVWTRFGWRKVLARSERRGVTHLYKCRGTLLRCTENHRFFDGKGFRPISSFTREDAFLRFSAREYARCLKQTWSSSAASSSAATRQARSGTWPSTTGPAASTATGVSTPSTGKSGRLTSDPFRKATSFITRMAIRPITALRISSAFLGASTRAITLQIAYRLQSSGLRIGTSSSGSGLWPRLGIALRRAWNSIALTGGGFGRASSLATSLATSAGSDSNPRPPGAGSASARTPANPRGDELRVWMTKTAYALIAGPRIASIGTRSSGPAPANALSVSGSARTETVYNLTVADHPEYFANGVLVSNCDALRYCAVSIPWDWTAIQGQVTEEQKQVERVKTEAEYLADEIRQRRGDGLPKEPDGWEEFRDEIEFWNDQAGS